MKKFKVFGDYGPQGWQSIELEIEAEDGLHARNQFQEIMEAQHPVEWANMGRRNVSVYQIDEEALEDGK